VTAQTIVIIDDRITNLKILERLAGSLDEGVTVLTFGNPRDALAAMAEQTPDLVITDFKMPDLDGAEFIRLFKQLPSAGEVPVIVITAYEDNDLRYRALEAGASDYLLSPVDHHEFRARSKNLLTLRRQQALLRERASSLEEQIAVEERRHRDALRQSHERLLRVIDAVPVMIGATDRGGRFVFANDRWLQAVGAGERSVIGLTPIEVRPSDWARRLMDQDRRLIAGEAAPGSFEESFLGAGGESCILLTTKSVLGGEDGLPSMVVTVSIDITERKNAELALRAAKEIAELANRSKTEFLANMSHELRTPLNAIIGFSQVMAGEMLGPMGTAKYIGYARDIAGSAEHLLKIINDILDVSKVEAGKLGLDEEVLDPAKAVRDILRLVEERVRRADLVMELDLEPALPQLRADARKIKQVLLNLATNAIKFSHPGGTVTLGARARGGEVSLFVQDRGIGMDEAELKTAVTRFGQVASPWSRSQAGTGLGLPLAIGLAELHDAELKIRSRKGNGTTATVTFPMKRTVLLPSVLQRLATARESR
jgi:two-component system, cell cycle sensor histidine kinase PleC